MGTLTRKQREVRQRETALLGIARKMLIEQGYAGLSMDRLAEATEYSKGAIYQHFFTKEDLITALAVESSEGRLALDQGQGRARTGVDRVRGCCQALGFADELFFRLYPHYFRSELIIHMAGLDSRASSGRREAMTRQDQCVATWLREIVQEAAQIGDLPGVSIATAGEVAFSIFSMAIGTHLCVINFPHVVEQLGVESPWNSMRDNVHALLDGLAGNRSARSGLRSPTMPHHSRDLL